jgi:hypothetical protein
MSLECFGRGLGHLCLFQVDFPGRVSQQLEAPLASGHSSYKLQVLEGLGSALFHCIKMEMLKCRTYIPSLPAQGEEAESPAAPFPRTKGATRATGVPVAASALSNSLKPPGRVDFHFDGITLNTGSSP